MKRSLGMALLLGAGLLLGLAGCEREPTDLGSEYHPGKCVVCQKQTKVRTLPLNPMTGYSIDICWRKSCQTELSEHNEKYFDKSKLAGPNVTPGDNQSDLAGGGKPVAPR